MHRGSSPASKSNKGCTCLELERRVEERRHGSSRQRFVGSKAVRPQEAGLLKIWKRVKIALKDERV